MTNFYIDFLERVSDDIFRIEGYSLESSSLKVVTSHGGFPLSPNGNDRVHKEGNQEVVVQELEANIKVSPHDTIRILSGMHSLHLHSGKYSGLTRLSGSYTKKQNTILYKTRKSIVTYPHTKIRSVFHELIYLARLLFNWRIGPALGALKSGKPGILKAPLIIAEAIVKIPQAIILRVAYHTSSKFKRRQIWLISDRGMAAGDNGEAFFCHISSGHKDEGRDVYFVLARKSRDYPRLRQYGQVLDPKSFRYKLKFLLSDKVISSHADIEVTNPFLRQLDHFSDLYTFDFIFLQHGIIRNDLSGWLNRYEQNIRLFVTSAKKEYDSILNYPYYYSADRVLLSGLPRYDLLQSNAKNKLLIIPTYRRSLLRLKTDKYGHRKYDPDFKNSEYFTFYDRLIKDKRLHEAMASRGMEGVFYLHPNFASQREDFRDNELFTIPDFPYDYGTAFKEGSLLVSDYSSVVFDFAYLKKPVIYTKFDEDTFFKGHTYTKGDFFSDEADGFGIVTYTYDELVNEMIASVEAGCSMEEKYVKRVNQFFYKTDNMNSERVFQAIIDRTDTSV